MTAVMAAHGSITVWQWSRTQRATCRTASVIASPEAGTCCLSSTLAFPLSVSVKSLRAGLPVEAHLRPVEPQVLEADRAESVLGDDQLGLRAGVVVLVALPPHEPDHRRFRFDHRGAAQRRHRRARERVADVAGARQLRQQQHRDLELARDVRDPPYAVLELLPLILLVAHPDPVQ